MKKITLFFFGSLGQFKNSFYLCITKEKQGAIAQLVEQRTENPCVTGSIPVGTTFKRLQIWQIPEN